MRKGYDLYFVAMCLLAACHAEAKEHKCFLTQDTKRVSELKPGMPMTNPAPCSQKEVLLPPTQLKIFEKKKKKSKPVFKKAPTPILSNQGVFIPTSQRKCVCYPKVKAPRVSVAQKVALPVARKKKRLYWPRGAASQSAGKGPYNRGRMKNIEHFLHPNQYKGRNGR